MSARLAGRLVREERGQVLALTAAGMLVVLLAAGALAIDYGQALVVKRQLQSSADAAALAGASALPNRTAAVAVARDYSAIGRNALGALAGDVAVTADPRCPAANPSCSAMSVVRVTQTATVKTHFARLFGVDSVDVTARANACKGCGNSGQKVDVMVVIDRTGSMAGDPLNAAKLGALEFVKKMDPAIHRVGLTVFPPAPTVARRCDAPDTSYTSTAYVVVPLSSDYKVGNQVNYSSNLIQTGACIDPGGNTAYANALESASAALNAQARPDAQKVIVFMSDGEANTGPPWAPSSYRNTPCGQAVSSAAGIKGAGTLVYTIGYDLGTNGLPCKRGGPGGPNESPYITSVMALQTMATSSSRFYRPNQPSELTDIFADLGEAVVAGPARLVDDDV